MVKKQKLIHSNVFRMRPETTIVCVLKTGGDFHFEDVLLLSSNLQKQWKGEGYLRTICLWDQTEKQIEFTTCTILPFPHPEWKGWWSKLNLFSPEMEKYRPFLFLDLDTAIVGDLTEVLPREEDRDKFILLRDLYRPKRLATGMMWIPAGSEKVQKVWDYWIANNPLTLAARYRGDNNIIENSAVPDLYFQDYTSAISSFKPDKKWLVKVPEGIKIVCFHGKPRIFEAAKSVEWVKKYVNGTY